MKNLTKLMGLLVAAALALPGQALAGSVTTVRKTLSQTRDGSGYPLALESDRAWKVFEVKDTTTETQVVDESSVSPVAGVLRRVCVESAAAIPAATDWAVVWDSYTETGIGSANRRLLPPMFRLSAASWCSPELNAMFTRGLRVKNGSSVGGTYIYWRELGAAR